MRKSLAAVAFSSALFVTGQANAVTVVALGNAGFTTNQILPNAPVPPNSQFIENFNSTGVTLGNLANFTDSFATWTTAGSAIVQGSSTNNFAAPWSGGPDPTPYLSVFGNTTETIALKSGLVGQQFGLFIGSLDAYNTIKFYNGATLIASFTGADIASLTGMSTTQPNTANYLSNQYVEFSGLGTFNEVVLGSVALNSFEVDNVSFDTTGSTNQGGVPETSTWVMMILGFLGVGFAAYRRKSSRGMSMRWA